MGVTRDNRDLFIYGMSDDELELLHQHHEEDSQANEELRSGRKNGSRHRVRSKGCQLLDNQGLNRRKTGVRQARRTENFRQLLTLAEKDELGEIELDTVFEPSMSVFAKLFSDSEKMKIWNNFMNQSEDEQERLLHSTASRGRLDSEGIPEADSILDESWEEIPDKRAAHPAFTAEECYKKIDRRLKDTLRRRHLPMGLLKHLEEDIVSFFQEWPSSVFVSRLPSGFERMLVHALCQFLDLRSHSYDENGERTTQIENKHDTFLPPSPLLTQYLQQRQSSSRC